jgi:hypothetical protein
MKILIAGSWRHPMYEKAFADALTLLACEIIKFAWFDYFNSFIGKAEDKYAISGPQTKKLNKDFLNCIASFGPDTVLVWRGTHIWPLTLKKVRKFGVRTLASYNHDDFSGVIMGAPVPYHHHLMWRYFLSCAPHYDFHLVKRESNVSHLESLGCKNNHVMPVWFVPEIHKPMELSRRDNEKYCCDVVYVGHYEPDGREEYLRALVKVGTHVRLYGGKYWTKKVLGDLSTYFGDIYPVYGEDYTKALCGAKMCLCFLSKLNRDTYTRRCFEIPACGKLLLSERSDDLKRMFVEDEEAVFFSSTEELEEKACWLLNHPDDIERIAEAGRKRVWADGHDVNSRARQFVHLVSESLKV